MGVSLFGKVRLGYVLIESNRLVEWKEFGANGLGLHVDVVDSGALAFRIDDHQRRLIVTPGLAEDVTGIGMQVDDETALNEVVARLETRGIVVHDGTPDEARLCGVERLVKFIGPKRLNFGLYTQPVPSEKPLKMLSSGFATGAGGLGHIAFSSREPEAFQAFWQEVFDARLSDHIEDSPGGLVLDITFLRLNERHHSVAIAATRGRIDALLGIISDTPLRTGSACNWPDRNSLNCWAHRVNGSIKSSNPWSERKPFASNRVVSWCATEKP